MNMTSSCLLLLSDKAKTKVETKFTKKIIVSDVVQVIEGMVTVHCHRICLATIMVHSSMHPTA